MRGDSYGDVNEYYLEGNDVDMTVTLDNLHTIWVRTNDGRNVNLRDCTDDEMDAWAFSRWPNFKSRAWPLQTRVTFCNWLQQLQGPLYRIVEDK